MARPPKPQLEPFLALNSEEKRTSVKASWKQRYVLIQENFPASVRLDWAEAFKDVDLFGRLFKDILRIDQNSNRHGVGPRVVDENTSRERLRQLMGEDFSYEPFSTAFPALAGRRSVRNLAAKIGLGKHMTHDLILGRKSPDLYTLEQIAYSFGKDPSYFLEYRIAYVLGALGDHMELSPETTVDLYKKLRDKRNVGVSNRRSKRGRESALVNSQ